MLTDSEFDERIKDAVVAALDEYQAGKRSAPDLLTVEQMAERLGCSRQKLTKLRADGLVPAIKLGDVYRYEAAAVLAALRGDR
ncbi:MAG TPA: helix-turn-helix domain-containing protein [Polyangiaceae bacterium]|nr:helix-turn-helix domain-containing protein [Polyangiaceae bacterium]